MQERQHETSIREFMPLKKKGGGVGGGRRLWPWRKKAVNVVYMFMEGEMGVLCKNNEFKVPKVSNVL